MEVEACGLDPQYDQCYFNYDAGAWSCGLDFKLRHEREPGHGQQKWHETEVIPLPQRDRASFYASKPDVYCLYKLDCHFGVPMPPLFLYRSGILVNGTDAEKKVVLRIAEVELSVLSFSTFFRAVRVGSVK